jgi:hypothetical protein
LWRPVVLEFYTLYINTFVLEAGILESWWRMTNVTNTLKLKKLSGFIYISRL